MFIVYIGSILTTLLWIHTLSFPGDTGMSPTFVLAVTVWLWFTVLFANFAEALAEGRSKAQAACCAACARTPGPRSWPSRSAMRSGFRSRRPTCARATWCWSRPATWSRSTAR